MSALSIESTKKTGEMDIASNSQNMQSEFQKAGENSDKNKNKGSSDTQGNCYWYEYFNKIFVTA